MNQPLRIYLDQNKWIDVARAYHDRPDGARFKPVLEKIKVAVDEGRVILPLSGTHVIETRKVADLSRRLRLSQAMSNISRGWSIAPYYLITHFELRAHLAKTFGHQWPAKPILFSKGVPFACGIRATLKDISGAKLTMSLVMSEMIDGLMSEAKVIEDFMCGGDETVNLAAIKKYEGGQLAIVERQEQFRYEAKRLGQGLHTQAYCGMLTLALGPNLIPILAEFGKSMQDFLDLGKDRLMTIISDVPTLDVETKLAVARNEDWNRGIDTNDSDDLAFLCAAIPYCDIVVTERYWRHQVQKGKIDKKYNATILDDLVELETYLN